MLKKYLKPVQQESILKREHVKVIFSNIDQLITFHASLLKDLEPVIENWTSESCIGKVFKELLPYLRLYKEYCRNYHEALMRVEKKTKSSARFGTLVNSLKETEGLDLSSLLIQPIQRIPRYRLLFSELLKATPENHQDYIATKEALQQIEDVAACVNESVRDKENLDKLVAIQVSLTGNRIPTIVKPKRKYIREGMLIKMCRREPKKRYFFLLTDLLIYCDLPSQGAKPIYSFHRALSLKKMRLENMPDSLAPGGFSIL